MIDKLVSLTKRRGFIFPSSEIYGGIQGFWDYGPLGVELKNNIKKCWWEEMVYSHDNIVGLDGAIILNPQVWVSSGHTKSFTDPLVECKICHKRFKQGEKEEIKNHEKSHNEKIEWTKPKSFNLLTEVLLGTTIPKKTAYLRGEITQNAFVNFDNIVSSSRVKIPFGIAQIGKAFRNEITPGNFTFRSREFEQMELEYFIKPDEKKAEKVFHLFEQNRLNWYKNLGIKRENLRLREHTKEEKAHYAKKAVDIEYQAKFTSTNLWCEFEGIHNRGDFDLSQHKLKYKDPQTQQEYIPWVIETSAGVDRAALFFLLDSFCQEKKRTILKLHPRLAPYKAAVFPLLANKEKLVNKAKKIYRQLKQLKVNIAWDERGNIGKRYLAQDEIGTPYCVTIDFETLEDNSVTVRDRDSTKQERIKADKLDSFLRNKLS